MEQGRSILSNDPSVTSQVSRGLTLVEALVAMTILAVGIVGVAGTFSLCMRAAARSLRFDEASRIAQRHLELAAAFPSENLQDTGGSDGRFKWRLSVQDMPDNLMSASVVVTWADRGRQRDYRLSRVFVPRRPTSD